jgi:hypothetical protein
MVVVRKFRCYVVGAAVAVGSPAERCRSMARSERALKKYADILARHGRQLHEKVQA